VFAPPAPLMCMWTHRHTCTPVRTDLLAALLVSGWLGQVHSKHVVLRRLPLLFPPRTGTYGKTNVDSSKSRSLHTSLGQWGCSYLLLHLNSLLFCRGLPQWSSLLLLLPNEEQIR